MNFEFSDRYEPLFDLLITWDEVDRISRIGLSDNEQEELDRLIYIAETGKDPTKRRKKYLTASEIEAKNKELLNLRYKWVTGEDKDDLDYFLKLKDVDTVLISGGRDSGKSFALSTFHAVAASDYNHRILYTRYTMSSTDNSITTALLDRMEQLGVSDRFDYANNNYTSKDPENKGKISI